ncbi:MAG: glycosyltransferase [Candidatus Diapherotrites archaeon]
MNFFSLGVCAFNEEESIAKMLNSVFGSTAWKNHKGRREIIVCANGCTDRTAEIVREIQKEHLEIKLIEIPKKKEKILHGKKLSKHLIQKQKIYFLLMQMY